MTARRPPLSVRLGVEDATLRIQLDAILPLRQVTDVVRSSVKYGQIRASIVEVGIIEPPVVIRDAQDRDRFHLLDGHLRIDILRSMGEREVVCLIALDDEAFTYNKRVSRLAVIQEHKMILNAVNRGVSEERLARALNVNIASIRAKRNLLSGICPEAADLLKDKPIPMNVFTELRYLKPVRQVEAAKLMIAANRFSRAYASSIVAATPSDFLVEGKRRRPEGLSDEEVELIQRESEQLEREFKLVERSYGADHLDLVLALGYVSTLLSNARIVRHLAQYHSQILAEFQKLSEFQKAA